MSASELYVLHPSVPEVRGNDFPTKDDLLGDEIENTPNGKKLIAAIKRLLSSDDTETVHYPPEQNTKTGTERFLVVDAEEENVLIFLGAQQPSTLDSIGRPNAVSVTWLEETFSPQTGRIDFLQFPSGKLVVVSFVKNDPTASEIEDWKIEGGFDSPKPFPKECQRHLTDDEIGKLANRLDGAHLNSKMTQTALGYTQRKYAAQRASDSVFVATIQTSPPRAIAQ